MHTPADYQDCFHCHYISELPLRSENKSVNKYFNCLFQVTIIMVDPVKKLKFFYLNFNLQRMQYVFSTKPAQPWLGPHIFFYYQALMQIGFVVQSWRKHDNHPTKQIHEKTNFMLMALLLYMLSWELTLNFPVEIP